MKKNLRIGFIVGIALFMLLPVYATAQMNLILNGGATPGTSIASINATQGDTINFGVTSTLLGATIQMVSNPGTGAQFTPNTFTWNTGGNTGLIPAGPYVAVFEASTGEQYQYLVVMIRVNASGSTSQPSCSYTYSLWGTCTGGTQTRTITSGPTPANCVGDPVLQQSCTSTNAPPPTSPPTGCATTTRLDQSYPSSYEYGLTYVSIPAGSTRCFTLPVGLITTDPVGYLTVNMAPNAELNSQPVYTKLIDPYGWSRDLSNSSMPSASFSIFSTIYGTWANYPYNDIPKLDWTLQVTATSGGVNFRISWYAQ